MKAISIIPGTTEVDLIDIPEPQIASDTEVKVRVLELGICGTDKEEVSGGRADAPAGQKNLIIGHEVLGEVVDFGSAVTNLKKGELVTITVRRGCGHCNPCLMNRSDYCLHDDYKERGIKGLNGFQAEYVVDKLENIIPVPTDARNYGVLTEPMAVVQKGLDAASRAEQARMTQLVDPASCFVDKRVLIAGLGPVGILAALALRLRGADVVGIDILDASSENSQLLTAAGGRYIDAKKEKNLPKALQLAKEPLRFIIDTTGSAKLEIDLISMLGHNGVYTILGIPQKGLEACLPSAAIQQIVLQNLMILGSVNESRMHMVNSIRDLHRIAERWGKPFVKRIITHKFPYTDFKTALTKPHKDAIKVVIVWHK